jgi:DNA-directed RNA polymerase specialized sigma subunit
MAAQYLPMAQALVNGWRNRGMVERDELQSTAYLALVEAARTFDPSRNVHFSTYARYHIEGALNACNRFWLGADWRGDESVRPMFQKLGKNPDLHGQVLGIHADFPVGAISESIEVVEEWLNRLPAIHAWTCRLIYVYGMSHDEAADQLGYSRSYLFRLHKEALTELVRHQMSAEDRPQSDPAQASE